MFLLISVPRSYGFDISKRCDVELKIAVHFMDVDDVDVGVNERQKFLELTVYH